MKTFAVTVAVLALGLAACESRTEEAVENDANVENAAEADTNAATNDAANAADNALDTAGNAVEDAGNAVENAGEAVENAADNATD
ncbi:circumsporozoite protein [Sphingomonas sp.]|uniref:circumsporozoite protein n=1 Tax=Sphingomonas sp. TaxID=28214 RepID=UPI00344E9BCA